MHGLDGCVAKAARDDDANGRVRSSSRNDIRRDLVFDEGDTVAQLQLAFLQPLQPQQIRRRRVMQGVDGRVEIAVLLLHPGQLGREFAIVVVVVHEIWR
jgi:hypothetical protein